MDSWFEALIETMKKGFEDAKRDRAELRVFMTTLSSRGEKELQDTILYLLQDKLIQDNIKSCEIKKVALLDKDGKIYYENYITDIDVVIQDSKTMLIEVIFHADNRDVFDLLNKAKLYKLQFKKEYDELILLCLEINQKNFEQAVSQGIRVITGKIS